MTSEENKAGASGTRSADPGAATQPEKHRPAKPAKPATSAGRPRSEACHQAILDAALQLLDTEDFKNVTIEKIARLAKAGKPTIYRWWPTKADLILEAYRAEGLRRVPAVPPSADALADLEDFLKRLLRAHRNRTHARGLRALIAESQSDEAFREKFYNVFLTMRRGLMLEIIERGIADGTFRADLDREALLDLMFGAFWYRLLSRDGAPLDDEYAEQIMGMVTPGILARKS